jgi:hypothetical protein
MGMMESLAGMPDVYGLPIYRVNRTIMRRVGNELHILCGSELFGQVSWTHIEVLKIETVLVEAKRAQDLASSPAAALEFGLSAAIAH